MRLLVILLHLGSAEKRGCVEAQLLEEKQETSHDARALLRNFALKPHAHQEASEQFNSSAMAIVKTEKVRSILSSILAPNAFASLKNNSK